MNKIVSRSLILTLLVIINLAGSTRAQNVTIPDSGLDAAIRAALQKPTGPLTEQDLLSLTNLDASRRNIASIEGLQAAGNLLTLNLQINHLTSFSLPADFTNLLVLDLSVNSLTNLFLPTGLTNLRSLTCEGTALTNLTL